MPNDEQNAQYLKEIYNFEITPCDKSKLNNENVKKLELSSSQKSQMSLIASQIPTLATAGAVSQLYTVRFPVGFPHDPSSLMRYSTGGVGAAIMGNDGIVAHASFHQLTTEAALLGAFSVMSIATGQYFLTEINNEFKMLNQKIDKIVDFLYGDKKAELMSEISFAQSAYKNFNSLMANEYQRIATITGLQESRKVAMKDIEFYLCDLDGKANSAAKSFADFESLSYETFKIKESLDLSMQLYVTSNIMEVYYAQNYNSDYINSLKDEMNYYINKCEKRILTDFGKMHGHIKALKLNPLKKADPSELENKITKILNSLGGGEKSGMNRTIDSLLNFSERGSEYYLSKDGDVYIKTAI